MARSPIFTSFAQALHSRVTVRAYGVVAETTKEFHQHLDSYNSVYTITKVLERSGLGWGPKVRKLLVPLISFVFLI